MDANNLPWKGYEVHGFSSEHVLRCELAKAVYRPLSGNEICALLMNGARFVEDFTPVDTEERVEFTWYVINANMWHEMKFVVAGQLNVAPGVDCVGIKWLLYDEDGGTKIESPVRTLKVNERGLFLNYYEVPGNVRTRRRVHLPVELRDGETYHFLQYFEFQNVKKYQKMEVQAGLHHAPEAESSALNAKAAFFASIDAEYGPDLSVEQWNQILAGIAVDLRCEGHLSSGYLSNEDEDYVNEDEDPSTGSESDGQELKLELEFLLKEQELPASKVAHPDEEFAAILKKMEANPDEDIQAIIEEVKKELKEKEALEGCSRSQAHEGSSSQVQKGASTTQAQEGAARQD